VPSARLALFRAGTAVASVLPPEASCQLALATGRLVGHLPDFDGRRAVVASHMARVLGRPLEGREAKRLVADVFANYARYWAESFRLPSVPLARVVSGVSTVGEGNLDAALSQNKGVVIAAPHLGGWEWGALYLMSRGLNVTVAVEPLEPAEVFEWFVGFRERLGMNVVPVGPGAGARILQALRQGHAVCLLSDRLVGRASGAEVDFFGARVKMPAGPATLALRSGAPLMCAAIYYGKPAGSHKIVFRPALELRSGGPFRCRAEAATQLLANELEVLVRAAPTQWHIVQPNWPDDPCLKKPSKRAPEAKVRAGALTGSSAQ
jgi:phosphatidylinositol dimannoside acyltransferase